MSTYNPSSERKRVPPTDAQFQAILDGYGPLTTAYSSMETFMLDRAITELKRSNIEYRLVAVETGTELWRKNLRKLPKH
jgi:hypothetical protein